jgi:hypothetical protein
VVVVAVLTTALVAELAVVVALVALGLAPLQKPQEEITQLLSALVAPQV